MSTARMMMTMTTRMKNIALAPFDDAWALAAGRRLIPGVCFPNYAGIQ
jgi:hypothetical protein